MSVSHSFRPTELRRAVGQQLARYREDRRSAAAAQRQLLAAQSAQIHDIVTETLADLDADLATCAEVQRTQLQITVDGIRADVAGLLEALATQRRAGALADQRQRAQHVEDLRRQVATYLSDLRRQRSARASGQWTRLRCQPASAPLLATSDAAPQRIGQAGMVAYVQMARVAILRALESIAPGDAQAGQIGPQIEGLIGSLKTFLAEATREIDQLGPAERARLGEVLTGVQRNLVALILELETTPWPTVPAQRQAFLQLVEDLRQRLLPLRAELDQALQAFEGAQRPVMGKARRTLPAAEPSARSYRDNLTTIHGIGPALQQRLDRAGICTYIQLALSSPEELRKALGDAGRLANVEDWIVQARSLAGMSA